MFYLKTTSLTVTVLIIQCNSNFKLVYFCKCAFYCCDRVDVTVTGYDYVFLEPSSDFVKDKLSSLLRVEITQFFLSVP